jgi:transposase, IS30 family
VIFVKIPQLDGSVQIVKESGLKEDGFLVKEGTVVSPLGGFAKKSRHGIPIFAKMRLFKKHQAKKRNPMHKEYNIHHIPSHHLTFEDRRSIAIMYNRNLQVARADRLSMRSMARSMGLPFSTLHREIKRGIVNQPMLRNSKEAWEYSEHIAQDQINSGNMNKGRGMAFTNSTAMLLATKIKDERKSPAHALRDLEREGFDGLPCLSSVYNHIAHGDIGILQSDTPYGTKGCRKRKKPPRKSFKMIGSLSIEDRPDISDRLEFGHWEMDTVISCIHGKGGLLVLIERKTRFYIIIKLKRISQKAVLNAIRKIIRSGIMKVVKSITTDNGCEFLNSEQIKALFNIINQELKIYYTHAYAAWEKGSVENANRHIRRFYKKGTDFNRVTSHQINELQKFINSIPRKTLKGLDAHETYLSAA